MLDEFDFLHISSPRKDLSIPYALLDLHSTMCATKKSSNRSHEMSKMTFFPHLDEVRAKNAWNGVLKDPDKG